MEDGTILSQAFGADSVTGEIVFNTGMTGYQEVYHRPVLQWSNFDFYLSTCCGVNRDDYESIKPTTKGVVVSEG